MNDISSLFTLKASYHVKTSIFFHHKLIRYQRFNTNILVQISALFEGKILLFFKLSVYRYVLGAQKKNISEIKDAKKRFVIICSYLVKVLPTSDQFHLIMFDNLYIKHNISNLGGE